ncbi:MAG: hypothetical protein ABL921_06380 [Pirellula sp.]
MNSRDAGWRFLEEDRLDEAQEYFLNEYSIHSQNAMVLAGLASVSAAQKDYVSAVGYATRALHRSATDTALRSCVN